MSASRSVLKALVLSTVAVVMIVIILRGSDIFPPGQLPRSLV
jgi:hypothetical protein